MATEPKTITACPDCGSTNVSRSHRRNLVERAAAPVALPWRCQMCGRRFYETQLPVMRARLALRPLRVPVLLGIAVAVLALWPIRREVVHLFATVFSVFARALDNFHSGVWV